MVGTGRRVNRFRASPPHLPAALSRSQAKLVAFHIAQDDVPISSRYLRQELLFPRDGGAQTLKPCQLDFKLVQRAGIAAKVEPILDGLLLRHSNKFQISATVRRTAGRTVATFTYVNGAPSPAPHSRIERPRPDPGNLR